jgi:hypothetical protein
MRSPRDATERLFFFTRHAESAANSLIRDGGHKAARPTSKHPPDWPDGRRKFGTVGAAIISVLGQTESDMRVNAIHAEVEHTLGGTVSRTP